MIYLLITFGILGLIALAAMFCGIAMLTHQLSHAVEVGKRIEKNTSPDTMFYADVEGGLPEKAVEEIMRHIRGETKEMKSFLDVLKEEKEDDEQDED